MRHWLIGTLLLLSLVACSEDEDCEPEASPNRYGDADLLMNGEAYTFAAAAGNSGCDSDNLTVALGYYAENNYQLMSLNMSNFPARVGTYTLERRESGQSECALDLIYGSAATWEDDALVEIFEIVEEAGPNELIITHYDSAARRLEGRFQMTLVVKDLFRIDNLDFPDTLHIDYGTFSTEILPPDIE